METNAIEKPEHSLHFHSSDYYCVLLQIENIHREHYLYCWQPDPLNCYSMCITELCMILAEHCK
jgi:hypothetical protein